MDSNIDIGKSRDRYMKPTLVWAFAHLFRNEIICVNFLNSVLTLDLPIIKVLRVTESSDPNDRRKKHAVVYFVCLDSAGNKFLVEIMTDWMRNFFGWMDYCMGDFPLPISRDEDVSDISVVYSINIVSHGYYLRQEGFKSVEYKENKCVRRFSVDKCDHSCFYDYLNVVFIDLSLFDESDCNDNNFCRWMKFFSFEGGYATDEFKRFMSSDVSTELALCYMNYKLYLDYEISMYMSEFSTESKYEMYLERKRDFEGYGEKSGMSDGKRDGIVEGTNMANDEMSKSLLSAGFTTDKVAKYLGISEMDVKF